jgi:two-component system response regulator DesR
VLESGVVGFLVKDAPAELAASIRRAVAGERVTAPELAVTAFGPHPLTERERAVLRAARGGGSIAEIAAQLILAEGTMRNYLSEAVQKLDARNRVDAAQIAEEQGWL